MFTSAQFNTRAVGRGKKKKRLEAEIKDEKFIK